MTLNIILIILVTALVFLVILQISKASEYIGILKGEEKSEGDSYRSNAAILTVVGFLFLILSIVTIFTYKSKFLPVAASEHGVWIDQLIVVTLIFTGIIYVITHVLLFWFVWKYRYSEKRSAYYFPDDNRLELAWTIVPAIVLTIMVAMGLQKWFKIFQPAPTDAIVIEATAKQFQWMIRYPGMDNQLGIRDFTLVNAENELGINWSDKASHDDFMADEIVLPVNKPVLVRIGALDVLHNFYLPHFRLKMDAVPGIPTKFWFRPTITTDSMRIITGNPEFNYELACAELCGSAHYNMRKVVKIVSDVQYDIWKRNQKRMYTAPAAQEPVAEVISGQ
jgi:cytochrome c oxidase subunit II